ncbi:hypothetical protein [Trujillonella endophytica]|uniref:hypothetical protein n=1 Tax=Trujillonella endophytica TaxID=673521 RepID=UPI000B84FFB3|nr:hypothetical protein [Trujillella endophytica]
MTQAGEAFDAWPILAVLERHGMEFVVVGGYAARMHGAQRPTRDVDVTPRTTRENLGRLAPALEELDARIRSEADPAGFPFAVTGESLADVRMLNLQTRHGELDLTVRPAAFEGGYDDLLDRSRVLARGDPGARRGAGGRHPVQGDRRQGAGRSAPCRSCIGWLGRQRNGRWPFPSRHRRG